MIHLANSRFKNLIARIRNPMLILKTLILLFALAISKLAYSQQDEIIIGLDADLSAAAAEGGIAIKRGALLAIDEINSKGGALGRPLRLLALDHRGNPARGIAVIGGVHTPVALAELPTIHEHQLIYLGAWAAGTHIVDNNYSPNYVFRASVRDAEASTVLIEQAYKINAQRIALVLERTAWGRANLQSIKTRASEQGIDIVHVAWINWRQADFTQEIEAISDHKPDAILLVSNAPEGAVVIRHLHEIGASIPVVSHWGIAGGKFVQLVGLEALRNADISVLQTFSFAQPKNYKLRQRILRDYRNTFDPHANEYSIQGVVGIAQAYDLVHLLAKAIERANTIERAKVQVALRNINEHQGLIKDYIQPFNGENQDALLAKDYFMSKFNDKGYLVPLADVNHSNQNPNYSANEAQ
jgi:branched-chain amino acid transport system substrate-binding protein